jgi:hypothetical protein
VLITGILALEQKLYQRVGPAFDGGLVLVFFTLGSEEIVCNMLELRA